MDEFDCPVGITTGIIGGKWKPLILFYLQGKTQRFSGLHRLIPNTTKKMLTQRLRELERDGIIRRKVYAQVPPRVEYSLTRHGQSLRPLLEWMAAWGKASGTARSDSVARASACGGSILQGLKPTG